jgi:SAM-dependent methyltransferase
VIDPNGRTWADVWNARTLDPSKGTLLAQLMAADGLDTGYGSVGEQSWRAFVRRTARRLHLARGSSVYEVGCGAGAFLLDLYEQGIHVAGVDRSPALIGFARHAMPGGEFEIGSADAFVVSRTVDAMVSCGVFLYFPSLAYASGVIDRLVAGSHGRIAILDIPDLARRDAALAHRRGTLGSDEYARRYAGLDHCFYAKEWMREQLAGRGLADVSIEDQQIEGYANAAFRFNAFARVTSPDA